jgi:hypothetical protein
MRFGMTKSVKYADVCESPPSIISFGMPSSIDFAASSR